MTGLFLLYAIIGKLLIYLGQKFPPLAESRFKFVRNLFACDLCLGCWIYTILAAFLSVRLLQDVYFYVPVVTEVITGCATSFLVHLISIGWQEKFNTIVI